MPLSENFLSALQEGHLSPLRSYVLSDRTVSPEIRDNTLSVYYRGKRLLKLLETPNGFEAAFDANYVLPNSDPWYQQWAAQVKELPKSLSSSEEVSDWMSLVPFAKAIMDQWIGKHGGAEREAQQQIVRENNFDGDYARATDYYFCDMERVEGDVVVDGTPRGLRFDLVGVHWPSTPAIRRQTNNRTLVIAEAKFGDEAHANDSGLIEHYRGLQAFVAESDRVAKLKSAMTTSFGQKHALGFIQCQRPLDRSAGFADESTPIVWLLILINHDPEKTALGDELKRLEECQRSIGGASVRIQVATSTFMGYGLWHEGVVDLDGFLNQYTSRISSRR